MGNNANIKLDEAMDVEDDEEKLDNAAEKASTKKTSPQEGPSKR